MNYAVTGRRGRWVVQPVTRTRDWRGRVAAWHYDPPVAGPFKTKREATEAKRDWEAGIVYVGDEAIRKKRR